MFAPVGFSYIFNSAGSDWDCLSLTSRIPAFPNLSPIVLAMVLLSPLSGLFYWKKSGRLEKVSLKVETTQSEQTSSSKITVVAHRDELSELQRTLQLKAGE